MNFIGRSLAGKFSAGISLLGLAAAFVLVSAMTMLAPTKASAQFNIEGMIRGAIGHGGYGYRHRGGGGSSHHRGHSSRRDRDNDDGDTAKSDKGKEKDALDEGASGQKASDAKPDAKVSRRGATPSRDAAQASESAAVKPGKSSDDEPSFAPSR